MTQIPSIKSVSASSIQTSTAGTGLGETATKISGFLQQYKLNLSGRKISPDSAKKAMAALSKATLLLINTGDKESWSVFLEFHKENATGVCKETVALTGIMTIADKTLRARTSFLYMAFRNIVDGHVSALTEKEFMDNIPSPKLYRYYTQSR